MFFDKWISIHTLQVEGDADTDFIRRQEKRFQSTPSKWRVTSKYSITQYNNKISIHTLQVEGDG